MDNEKKNQSIISLVFVTAGFLTYIIVAILFETLAGTFGPVARLHNMIVLQHGVPVAAGIITFLILFFNKKTYGLADETVTEVSRVVWPSQKDTVSMSIVVTIMVLLFGVGLGFFDFLSGKVMQLFVK